MTVVKTSNQLFPHDCQVSDMRFSAYNPQSVSFYCIECGGKMAVRVKRSEWQKLFGKDSLALNEKVLERVIDPDEEAAEVAARRARNEPPRPSEDDEEDDE